MVVRNANGIFGFVQAYAHYGRGLILWDGFDVDSNGTKWHDIVRAQQLAQGFNTDNLPCSIKIGSFAVTTEPRLVTRGVQPGQTYTYPLALLSNLGYKGTVSLSAAPTPAMPGLQARFEPATVEVTSLQESAFTVTLPAGGAVKPFAIEVKGTAADGKTNSLCLQLGPTKAGELAVISTLAPPTKTRKNLEIILDASGSMKTLMGAKQTRWDVALETLGQVLNTLPDDFNVGLRMYGHRELSTSPKTCTDTRAGHPGQEARPEGDPRARQPVQAQGRDAARLLGAAGARRPEGARRRHGHPDHRRRGELQGRPGEGGRGTQGVGPRHPAEHRRLRDQEPADAEGPRRASRRRPAACSTRRRAAPASRTR